MNNTSRFSKLLGECRRQMNGAVAGSMRYYGVDYGLNYGVSISTVRSLAEAEGKDHHYAKYLYQQQVREIRLAALHIAEPDAIYCEELDFWAEGIINSEVAEEASFALFQYVDRVAQWLDSQNELLIYTALLSIAKNQSVEFEILNTYIDRIIKFESMLLTSAVITLLENYYRDEQHHEAIKALLASFPENKITTHIRTEMEWRCDLDLA